MLGISAEARKVKGTVTSEGKGLSEVIVTDGQTFTQLSDEEKSKHFGF